MGMGGPFKLIQTNLMSQSSTAFSLTELNKFGSSHEKFDVWPMSTLKTIDVRQN